PAQLAGTTGQVSAGGVAAARLTQLRQQVGDRTLERTGEHVVVVEAMDVDDGLELVAGGAEVDADVELVGHGCLLGRSVAQGFTCPAPSPPPVHRSTGKVTLLTAGAGPGRCRPMSSHGVTPQTDHRFAAHKAAVAHLAACFEHL